MANSDRANLETIFKEVLEPELRRSRASNAWADLTTATILLYVGWVVLLTAHLSAANRISTTADTFIENKVTACHGWLRNCFQSASLPLLNQCILGGKVLSRCAALLAVAALLVMLYRRFRPATTLGRAYRAFRKKPASVKHHLRIGDWLRRAYAYVYSKNPNVSSDWTPNQVSSVLNHVYGDDQAIDSGDDQRLHVLVGSIPTAKKFTRDLLDPSGGGYAVRLGRAVIVAALCFAIALGETMRASWVEGASALRASQEIVRRKIFHSTIPADGNQNSPVSNAYAQLPEAKKKVVDVLRPLAAIKPRPTTQPTTVPAQSTSSPSENVVSVQASSDPAILQGIDSKFDAEFPGLTPAKSGATRPTTDPAVAVEVQRVKQWLMQEVENNPTAKEQVDSVEQEVKNALGEDNQFKPGAIEKAKTEAQAALNKAADLEQEARAKDDEAQRHQQAADDANREAAEAKTRKEQATNDAADNKKTEEERNEAENRAKQEKEKEDESRRQSEGEQKQADDDKREAENDHNEAKANLIKAAALVVAFSIDPLVGTGLLIASLFGGGSGGSGGGGGGGSGPGQGGDKGNSTGAGKETPKPGSTPAPDGGKTGTPAGPDSSSNGNAKPSDNSGNDSNSKNNGDGKNPGKKGDGTDAGATKNSQITDGKESQTGENGSRAQTNPIYNSSGDKTRNDKASTSKPSDSNGLNTTANLRKDGTTQPTGTGAKLGGTRAGGEFLAEDIDGKVVISTGSGSSANKLALLTPEEAAKSRLTIGVLSSGGDRGVAITDGTSNFMFVGPDGQHRTLDAGPPSLAMNLDAHPDPTTGQVNVVKLLAQHPACKQVWSRLNKEPYAWAFYEKSGGTDATDTFHWIVDVSTNSQIHSYPINGTLSKYLNNPAPAPGDVEAFHAVCERLVTWNPDLTADNKTLPVILPVLDLGLAGQAEPETLKRKDVDGGKLFSLVVPDATAKDGERECARLSFSSYQSLLRPDDGHFRAAAIDLIFGDLLFAEAADKRPAFLAKGHHWWQDGWVLSGVNLTDPKSISVVLTRAENGDTTVLFLPLGKQPEQNSEPTSQKRRWFSTPLKQIRERYEANRKNAGGKAYPILDGAEQPIECALAVWVGLKDIAEPKRFELWLNNQDEVKSLFVDQGGGN